MSGGMIAVEHMARRTMAGMNLDLTHIIELILLIVILVLLLVRR